MSNRTTRAETGESTAAEDDGARFAFLAETSRCLSDSLDLETTLATAAGLALPHFGTWCMVDLIEADDTLRRVAVIHPDPEKQRLAREFFEAHPPRRDDAMGAPRVIRTCESELVLASNHVVEGVTRESHRKLLQELGASSYLRVPMCARGRTLGAITFVSEDQRRHEEANLLLAEDLGRRCAMAVDNARLYSASEAARLAATLTARRAEELLDEANFARHEVEATNQAKVAFLGTISHEFRTPLTAVQGFTDLLLGDEKDPLPEAKQHQVERIRAASDHLLSLIDEILTFSQQQAGRSELRLREVDLASLVRETALIIEPLAAESELKLELQVPEGPIRSITDAGKLRQIILNLGSNAVKFTSAGTVRLELEVVGETVLLRVRDTGMGISLADAEHVFAPFWQVDQSNVRLGGTGLGLAVTRQLALLLGGDVSHSKAEGGGSIFTVRLPLDCTPAIDRTETSPASDPAAELRVSGRRKANRRGAKVEDPAERHSGEVE
jgi:signal transduction histidine kinase